MALLLVCVNPAQESLPSTEIGHSLCEAQQMLCQTDLKGSEDTFSNDLRDEYKIQHQCCSPQEASKEVSITHKTCPAVLKGCEQVPVNLLPHRRGWDGPMMCPDTTLHTGIWAGSPHPGVKLRLTP